MIEPAEGSAQVGSVEVVAIVGAPAGALMVTFAVVWHEPAALLTTVTVYAPAPTVVNVGDAWKFVPSIEYVYSVPSGAVTVMEPAAGSAHIGSVVEVVTVGAFAGALMVAVVVAWQLPATELTTVTVYPPAATPLNVGEDWKFMPSIE